MSFKMKWMIEGNDGKTLVGYDDDMVEQARVKVGEKHWSFQFCNFEGSGRVRIGLGCDYNPLQMVEAMFEHIAFGGLDPDPVVEYDLSDVEMGRPLGRFTGDFQ